MAEEQDKPLEPVATEEFPAVTGRPADIPSPNSTLASRAKASSTKQVDDDDTENKAVASAATKARSARKTAK